MNFSQAIKNGFKEFITFSGRASRSEFWWWTLFCTLIGMVAGVLDSPFSYRVGPFSVFISVFLLLPNVAVSVRRFHDVNRSGWWVLFFSVICLVGIGLSALGALAAFWGKFAMLLWGLALVAVGSAVPGIWVILKGTAGQNRFGPDPLSGEKGTGGAEKLSEPR